MPPHIQPENLQQMVMSEVKWLIIDSCVRIQERYGSYDEDSCQKAATDLQGFLLPIVKPFLDRICWNIDHSDLCLLSDKRIFFAVIVHNSTMLLNLNPVISRQYFEHESYHMFCRNQISKLDNLISLNIGSIDATKRVLETIAYSCYTSLQHFTITPMLSKYNDGLSYLSKCKELRYLKVFSSTITYLHPQTILDLRLLLLSLPKLEYFDNMNTVKLITHISNDLPVLSIKMIKDNCVNPVSMSHIVKVCPKLEDIDIQLISTSDGPEILKTLTDSNLHIRNLKLRGFLWHTLLEELLSVKGFALVCLHLDHKFCHITYQNICIIGKYCPYLKILNLDILETSEGAGPVGGEPVAGKTPPMFSQLESFCFGWYQCSSQGQAILPLVLASANNLSEVKLQCSTTQPSQDVLEMVLRLNPLPALNELSLIISGPGIIFRQSMSLLINSCQNLIGCYIYGQISRETRVFLQELYGRIRDENLKLQIDVFER